MPMALHDMVRSHMSYWDEHHSHIGREQEVPASKEEIQVYDADMRTHLVNGGVALQ